MAWNTQIDDEPKELAFDLRQKLAEQLGEIRREIIEVRLKKDYKTWLDLLDCLFIEVSKKLTDAEMKEYDDNLKKANEIIKKNRRAFIGETKDGKEIYAILKKIDIWINRKMERYDMFGSKPKEDENW